MHAFVVGAWPSFLIGFVRFLDRNLVKQWGVSDCDLLVASIVFWSLLDRVILL